ncbi:MAG: putative Ig domain-containing protein [Aureliella sp.]
MRHAFVSALRSGLRTRFDQVRNWKRLLGLTRPLRQPLEFNVETLEPRQLLAGTDHELNELLGPDLVASPLAATKAANNDAGNLIVNGSFEEGLIQPGDHHYSAAEIPGWRLASETKFNWKTVGFEIVSDPGLASDGMNALELDTYYYVDDAVFQDLATEAGERYSLSFDLHARFPNGAWNTHHEIHNQVEVWWEGSLVGVYSASTEPEWKTFDLELMATGDQGSRLMFRERVNMPYRGGNGYGPLIDNVGLYEASQMADSFQITPVENRVLNEGEQLAVQLQAEGEGSGSAMYSLVSGPAGAQLNSETGELTWSTDETHGPALYDFVVAASAGARSDQTTFSVQVNEVNSAPVLLAIPGRVMEQGQAFSWNASAMDADVPAQSLTYSLSSAPAGAKIDSSTGEIGWATTEATSLGDYEFIVSVSDGELRDETAFTVSIADSNTAPVIEAIGDRSIVEGSLLDLTVEASDADAPAGGLQFALSTAPDGAAIDSMGTIRWQTDESDGPGVYDFVVSVSDGSLAAEQRFRVTVTEENQAPTIEAIADLVANQGDMLRINAIGSDADAPAQTLLYSLDRGPETATIDGETGLISWDVDQEGIVEFAVRVTDSEGASAATAFRVSTCSFDPANYELDDPSLSMTSGDVQIVDCDLVLTEQQALVTEYSRRLTIENENTALRIQFTTPEFDETSQGDIRDAFEIEVHDADGNSLMLPFDAGRDAVFNWTEVLEPSAGPNATLSQDAGTGVQTLALNLSGLAIGTEYTFSARLVNNDDDTQSSVRLLGFEIGEAMGDAVAGAAFASLASARTAVAPLDWSRLADVTGSVRLAYGRTNLEGENQRLGTEATLENVGGQTYLEQIVLVIDQVSDVDINAWQPDGLTSDGKPYVNFSSLLTHDGIGASLKPGEMTATRVLRFLSESKDQFDFEYRVFARVNAEPSGFSSEPLTAVEAGKSYQYTAAATDPDGQPLVYSVVSGPEAMSIDESSGALVWETTEGDVGNHSITLRATDPYGAFVEQSFTLEVIESLPNRPPVFVTDPVTEATASSGFEITTVGVGNLPAGVSIVSGFQGPRLVTANEGDQTIGVYAGENNDRFDNATSYSTGFPTADGQLFDVGYSVDIGLRPFRTQSDRNEVLGLDQADINGDGILDMVAMAVNQFTENGTQYEFSITSLIGDGNGGFEGSEIYFGSIGTNSYSFQNLLLRDINGDGWADVLAVERAPSARLITLLNNGDGTFADATFQTFNNGRLSDFRVVDVNGDGAADLIGRTAQVGGGSIYEAVWLEGNGDGTFEEPVVIASAGSNGNGPRAPMQWPHDVGDVNGDGNVDFAIVTQAGVGVYHNDGAGNFTLANQVQTFVPRPDDWLRVADFDGDGNMDLLRFDTFNARLELFTGTGDGINFDRRIVANPDGSGGNAAGGFEPTDIDGDGDLDIALGVSSSNQVSIWIGINDGTGDFEIREYATQDFSGNINPNQSSTIVRGAMFGDYNNDGVTDFSYYTQSGDFDGVGIRLGTRPGEFGTSRSIPWVENPRFEVAVPGDIDGDGDIDLVDTNNDRTFLNLGNGTFSDPIPASGQIGGGPAGTSADFNLDGLDDIVGPYSTRSTGGYFVGLSNGDGTFSITERVSSGTFYNYDNFAAADLNGDGYPDFYTKNAIDNYIDFFINDSSNPGFFTRSLRYTPPAGSQGVNVSQWDSAYDVGDFTGDGILDFATAEREAIGDIIKVVVYQGDGTGAFTRYSELAGFDEDNQASILGRSVEPGDFVGGDIDGDGDRDLMAASFLGTRVFLNDGTGNFSFERLLRTTGTDQRRRESWLVDFNEDGNLDFFQTGQNSSGPLSVWLGDGQGNFSLEESVGVVASIPAAGNPFADIDGDGHLDFVYATGGNGNYGSDDAVIFAGRRDDLVDVVAIDLNGDGNEEILAVQEQMDRLQIFVGDNLGGLTRQPDLQTGRAPQAVAVGDLDADGQSEIFTANRASRTLGIFIGDLENGYAQSEIAVGTGPIDVETADVDGDGNADVVVLDDGENALWVLSGSGDGSLSAPIAIPLGDRPSRFVLADVDGDGNEDAVITLPDSQRLMIVPSIGNGTAAQPVYVSLSETPTDVAAIQLNDDGNLDLAVALGDLNTIEVFYGLGQNQFARPQAIAVGESPSRITVADADEDGRQDLVVSNSGDATVSVIYNRFDPNEVYRYDSDAIDPDDDTLTYAIVEGPGGLIINSTTGALLWAASPDQVGVHDVVISADDGRGGVATQSFKIAVKPARENSSPLIATSPDLQIGAGDAFTYDASAIDGDGHPLRYRLLEGPEGSTLDPVSGELRWDTRNDSALSTFIPWASTGYVRTPVNEALQPESITVEGWFNWTQLPAGNGADYVFYRSNDSGFAYGLSNRFNNTLRFEAHTDGGYQFYDFPFSFEANRWYHFAITIDDATNEISVYADAQLLFTRPLPGSIAYSNRSPSIHDNGNQFQGSTENYRIWNVARDAEQIREGLTKQYDNELSLVLDYRFGEDNETSVRDYSGNGNHGYRVANGNPPGAADGLADPGSYDFTIGVEDGRGGYDEQSFTLEVVPELRGSIVGNIFDDVNGDGLRNDGSEEGIPAELGLEGWQLYIDANQNGYPDPHEWQTVTDADGNYRFEGLLLGEYEVSVSPFAGYETPDSFTATVISQTLSDLDSFASSPLDIAARQLELSRIEGQLRTEDGAAISYWKVFVDANANGSRDEDEAMAVSDRFGNYSLFGLESGEYSVLADLPAGWTTSTGPGVVSLAADEVNSGNDFVLAPSNTSVTGGVHFVTMPNQELEARQTFSYASIAMSIGDEPLTYDLSLAPEGMTIDPQTGLVAWRPTIGQVGEHLVVLRATSESGSVSLHDFYLTVSAPNTPPTVLTEPDNASLPLGVPGQAFVGSNFAYVILAQDAEGQELQYALAAGPAGATIDLTTGRMDWTPELAQLGQQDFEVRVSDSLGAESTFAFAVNVVENAPTALPIELTQPRSTAAIGVDYFGRVQARDALGRDVNWSLDSGPDGLTLSEDGLIEWTPTAAQLGTQTIRATAITVDGVQEAVAFDIEVLGRLQNAAPVFVSDPIESVSLGEEYFFELAVQDTDLDVLAFTLLEGPVGMSVHPSEGFLHWTPEQDQLGEHTVRVQVADPTGDMDVQEFTLTVSRFGGPPRIVSFPPTQAFVGNSLRYTIDAVDGEGDPLKYSLLTAPDGMSIVEETGEIVWTPTIDQVGNQQVAIQVSDGIGGASTQAFVISVADGVPNLAPEISTNAPRFTAVGSEYQYSFAATDPEGTVLTYSLGRGPDGMLVDAMSGAVTWTPTVDQAGKHIVTLIATDEGGATAIESFEIDVLAANRAPEITSVAPVQATAGAAFSYTVLAADADLDPLQFELLDAPGGASIDRFGQINWTPAIVDLGQHTFSVQVTDPREGVAVQSFDIEVVEDTVAPLVSLIEVPNDGSRNILPWQGPFVVYARAIDNVGIASLTLEANGQEIALDAAGTATFTFEDWTFQTITATATAVDTSGNVATQTTVFNYDFPEGWSGAGTENIPTAIISSPSEADSVVGIVQIEGTADHEDFDSYRLSYRRADESTYTEFARGDTAVVDGELGVWDTSLLLNDEYFIRLEVATSEGVVNVAEHNVGLAGELKLGNFQLSFTDMVIPVAGIPIEITRIYDTLQADREGDFGFGWRLEYRDTDLRVGLPSSGLEDIGIFPALRSGVKVYLNVPGEGRQGFTFNPDIRVLPGFGGNNLVLARPRFTPDPGVTATLSTGTSSYLQVNERGELYAPGGIPYNPASPDFGGAYVLTTQEGITYRINGATGKLDSARDDEGNSVLFEDDGIFVSGGEQLVSIARDSQDRITEIQDPEGGTLNFSYSNGKLSSYSDRERSEVQFTYDVATGFLDEIIDPLGRAGTRSEYDENGRLRRVVDSNGNAIDVDHDAETRVQVVHNRLGNATTFFYDDSGNVVQEVDALGGVISREYDSRGNLIEEVDPSGVRVRFQYDANGRLLSETDGGGATTRYEYNVDGQPVAVVDAVGNRSSVVYEDGRVVAVQGPLGTRTFSQEGGVITETDATGRITTVDINANGLVNGINDGQNASLFSTDRNGNVLSETQLTQSGNLVTEFTWDGEGRLVATRDSFGNLTRNEYDAIGNRVAQIDPLGRRTEYRYDSLNNLVETIFPDATPEDLSDNPVLRYEYDENSRLIAEIDESGNTTRFSYDRLDRLIETLFPDDTEGDDSDNARLTREYDAAGRLIAEIDESGHRTEYEYDSIGRLQLIRDALGGETRRAYDSLGNLSKVTDPNGYMTAYSYDAAGNLIQTTYADNTVVKSEYDQAGRQIASVDQLGRATRYRYDRSGQLDQITDALGNSTTYTYDDRGNVIEVVDANGDKTSREFDIYGRVLAETDALGQRTSYTFDSIGRLLATTDSNGATTTFEYDERDRLVREVRVDGNSSFTYTPTGLLESYSDVDGAYFQTWDSRGRLLTKDNPDGQQISYSYDPTGNITRIESEAGIRSYLYDENGRMVSIVDPSGGQTEYEYDAAGNLVSIVLPNGISESRQFDELNRLVLSQTSDEQGLIEVVRYSFDATSRLETVTSTLGVMTTYAYDAVDRLISEIADDGTSRNVRIYEYDAEGNRLRQTDNGLETTYEYDSDDRLIREVTNGAVKEYEYDRNGNLIRESSSGSTSFYAWDSRNLLVGVDRDGDGTSEIRYGYDAQGIRDEMFSDGDRIGYVVDTNRSLEVVLEEVSESTTTHFTYGDGIVFSSSSGSQDYYYHSDIRGNVVRLSDPTGTVIQEYSYSAFGEILGSPELIVTNLFLGERLSEDGLYHLRARSYDFRTGRFISKDPFPADYEDSLSFNRFVYAQSDPINNNDPTGLFSVKGVLVSVAINATISGAIVLKTGGGIKDFAQDFAIGMLFGGIFKGISVGVKSIRGLYAAKALGSTGSTVASTAASQAAKEAAKEATKASVKLANYLIRRSILRTSTNQKLLARGASIIRNSSSPAKAVRSLTGGVGTNRFNSFIETRWIANKIAPEVWKQVPNRIRKLAGDAAQKLDLPESYVDDLITYLDFVRPFA